MRKRGLRVVASGALLLLLSMSHCVLADDFNDYQAYAKGMQSQGTSTLETFDPTTVPQYTDDPSTEEYYGGVDQTDPDMGSDAAKAEEENDATEAVSSDFFTRPRFEVNDQSYEISNSKYIQANAIDITTGDTSNGVVCTDGNGEDVPTDTETCVYSQTMTLSCYGHESVKVVYPEVPSPCQHVVQQTNNSKGPPNSTLLKTITVNRIDGGTFKKNYYVYIFLVNGANASQQCYWPGSLSTYINMSSNTTTYSWKTTIGLSYRIHLTAYTGNDTGGNTRQAQASIQANGSPLTNVTITIPSRQYSAETSKDIEQSTNMTISDAFTLINHDNSIELDDIAWLTVPQSPNPYAKTEWITDCDSMADLVNNGSCSAPVTACTDDPNGPTTKIIDGVPITEDCWASTTTYHCGQPDDGSCQLLMNKGCSQLSSTCVSDANGSCLAYQEGFVCPLTPPSGHKVVCGQPTFCETDDCSPAEIDENQNFDQAAAGLSTVDAEGQAVYNNQSETTFTGEVKNCEYDGVGFSNCCQDSGWGQDVNLAHCTDEEKQLGHDKEAGIVTYVGQTCEKHNTFGCYLYKKQYCVWPSLLDKDVQEQGRRDQLGIGFGSGDHPDCSGVTVDQIQDMDFNQIDFSNAYEEIEDNTELPDTDETQAQVEAEAANMAGGGA